MRNEMKVVEPRRVHGSRAVVDPDSDSSSTTEQPEEEKGEGQSTTRTSTSQKDSDRNMCNIIRNSKQNKAINGSSSVCRVGKSKKEFVAHVNHVNPNVNMTNGGPSTTQQQQSQKDEERTVTSMVVSQVLSQLNAVYIPPASQQRILHQCGGTATNNAQQHRPMMAPLPTELLASMKTALLTCSSLSLSHEKGQFALNHNNYHNNYNHQSNNNEDHESHRYEQKENGDDSHYHSSSSSGGSSASTTTSTSTSASTSTIHDSDHGEQEDKAAPLEDDRLWLKEEAAQLLSRSLQLETSLPSTSTTTAPKTDSFNENSNSNPIITNTNIMATHLVQNVYESFSTLTACRIRACLAVLTKYAKETTAITANASDSSNSAAFVSHQSPTAASSACFAPTTAGTGKDPPLHNNDTTMENKTRWLLHVASLVQVQAVATRFETKTLPPTKGTTSTNDTDDNISSWFYPIGLSIQLKIQLPTLLNLLTATQSTKSNDQQRVLVGHNHVNVTGQLRADWNAQTRHVKALTVQVDTHALLAGLMDQASDVVRAIVDIASSSFVLTTFQPPPVLPQEQQQKEEALAPVPQQQTRLQENNSHEEEEEDEIMAEVPATTGNDQQAEESGHSSSSFPAVAPLPAAPISCRCPTTTTVTSNNTYFADKQEFHLENNPKASTGNNYNISCSSSNGLDMLSKMAAARTSRPSSPPAVGRDSSTDKIGTPTDSSAVVSPDLSGRKGSHPTIARLFVPVIELPPPAKQERQQSKYEQPSDMEIDYQDNDMDDATHQDVLDLSVDQCETIVDCVFDSVNPSFLLQH